VAIDEEKGCPMGRLNYSRKSTKFYGKQFLDTKTEKDWREADRASKWLKQRGYEWKEQRHGNKKR
jgi:hypothetical protein